MKLAIVAEYNKSFLSHLKTDEALRHACDRLGVSINLSWVSTAEINPELLGRFDGFLIAPGSPYKSMAGALAAIRFARKNKKPLLANCGGFQHVIIEYARHVLQIPDAQHAEYDPDSSSPFISRLACSLVGRTLTIHLKPGSMTAMLYGSLSAQEQYCCNFGVNPQFVQILSSGPLQVVGSDAEGEIRVVELPDHPFFIGTLFVPQLSSSEREPHPLLIGFIKAISQAAQPGAAADANGTRG